MTHKHTYWLRAGLLIAILVVIGSLSHAPTATQAQGGGTISYGAKVFGTIAEDAPRVTYSFTGSAGDVITVIADNWTGALDLRAELIAPNGVILASSTQNTLDDNMQGAHLSAVLPDDGIYLLWITGENGSTGDFALTLLGRSAPDSTQLLFGQAVDVTLIPAADPQFFWFEAEDCPTTLLVTSPSEGQPFTYPFVVRVTDQRGQTVALLRGGEELEDWATVTPRSGRYEVEVFSDHPQETGDIRLLVTCAADAPGCPVGQAGISGVAGTGPQECPRCFVPGNPPESGGCPDLRFTVEQDKDDPLLGRVFWDMVPGATGYAIYVYGRVPDGGEVYLTHAEWAPGDSPSISWRLPEGYAGFRFVMRVYIGEHLVCTAETSFEVRPPDCEDFQATITDITGGTITLEWTDYPGAEGYSITTVDSTGAVVPAASTLVSPDRHLILIGLGPGEFVVTIGPWFSAEGMICPRELKVEIPRQEQQFPCIVRTNRGDVRVRVGPGLDRAAFAFLTAGVEYPVIGYAYDAAGNLWWQIDRSAVPGGEMALSLWVLASEVEALGNCDQVPPGEVPVPEPGEPFQPGQPGGPGQWLPCGSCDTCGHPANECVTSPEGQCLWDPATCVQQPEQPGEPG